jgi:hypothetical protein
MFSNAQRWAGQAWGASMAPAVGATSRIRRSRMFHPRGVIVQARVRALPSGLADVGERLSGYALVRFSGALWKYREWPDVLGCALRFRRSPEVTATSDPDDQDLLLATIRSPWTTLLAPLSTRQHDFLDNDYFGVSPFQVESGDRLKFRLRPARTASSGTSRGEKLSEALRRGPVRLTLAVRADRLAARYRPCAEISLETPVGLEDDALRFDPFRSGRGIRPVGLVHNARSATYAASRRFGSRAELARP